MSVGPGWNLVGFVNNPSEWCHSTPHLQNTSNIPQNPQKRQKKRQNIHNNIHSSSTTNYLHSQQHSLLINNQLFTHMEQKPWAKPRRDTWRSVACSRWWLCLPVWERNRPHPRVGRGIWSTLMSSPVCCHSVAPSVNGCCSNPMYKQYIHSMYTKYMLLC